MKTTILRGFSRVFLALTLLFTAGLADAETNRVYSPGYRLSVAASHPSAPTSGAPVRYGLMTGVAINDEDSAGNTSIDFGPGVWDLYVFDEATGGIAVGDSIYYDDTTGGSPATSLTNSTTGVEAFFGVALEVVSNGATTEIQVMHIPVGLLSTIASNAVTGAMIADDTVNGVDLADTITLDANLTLTGAFAINIGDNLATSVTIDTDGTGDAELVLPLQSVSAGEILNDTITAAQLANALTPEAGNSILGAGALEIGVQDGAFDFTLQLGDAGGVQKLLIEDSADVTVASINSDGLITGSGFTGSGATTYDAGGAAAIVIGSADVTSFTVTTDGTGNGEVVLPTGSIGTGEILDATLLPADDAYPGRGSFTVCGDLTTINNNTIYYGPSMVLLDSATTGMARTCDTTAAGNATEGTADEPAFTATAFQVLAMDCISEDANATVSFTGRSAEAALTPAVTCSVADNELGCVANTQTTTAIASGATFAIAAASSADMGDVKFVCTVHVAF